jgi:hypothetical protein
MIATGDVDGDGHEDVASVNGTDGSASILLGAGDGSLGTPALHATDPFTLAGDLGDLDGDGDLDWVTSSFYGDWLVFLNNGDGSLVFDHRQVAPQAASCSLLMDVDNDADLDMVLIDELADEVIVVSNDGAAAVDPPPVPDGRGNRVPLRVGREEGAPVITWDLGGCPADDYHLLYGSPAGWPAGTGDEYRLAGSRCGVGADLPFHWLDAPDTGRLLWFVLVARHGDAEGSWGLDAQGLERAGVGPGGSSGECGLEDRSLTGRCPVAFVPCPGEDRAGNPGRCAPDEGTSTSGVEVP